MLKCVCKENYILFQTWTNDGFKIFADELFYFTEIKLTFKEGTKNYDIGKICLFKVNTNGEPFSRIFWHEDTLKDGTKPNKTAWEVLKINKNKLNIKAPKRKLKDQLKIC